MPVFSDGQKINQADVWNRLIQSIPASYVVWKDGTTYRAECHVKDGIDYSGTDLATVIQAAIDATSAGTVVVKAMGAVGDTGVDLTVQITMKHLVSLVFEEGGLFNIKHNGNAFYLLGTATGADFCLYLGAHFRLYNYTTPTLVRMHNCLYCRVYVEGVSNGESGVLTNAKGIWLTGNSDVGAYYNVLKVHLATRIGSAIHFDFDVVGANANLVEFLQISQCDYGVKIDQGCGDNVLMDVVVTGGGVQYGAVWIDGLHNHIMNLYGEYASGTYGGPLLYLGANATGNRIEYIVQEGTGNIVSDNSAVGAKNSIGGRTPTYVTINSGYNTGTGAQQSIAHGCNFTPSQSEVFLSERTTGGALARQTAVPGATYIYITATSAKDYNWKVEKA